MAVATHVKKWTLRELHRLPDDGNKYEVVRGELFVTPPPTDEHETILAKLTEILGPYVRVHGLGHVYHPRAVMRFEGSEVEPDLMVRSEHPRPTGRDVDWTRAPIPILVVEIASGYTRRRDRGEKRRLYLDAAVEEYWIIDPEQRDVTVVHGGQRDSTHRDFVNWLPAGLAVPLTFEVGELF
ncbi:MAG TPA: Uma2 family endonuclease [Gemmatimonadaceae bacterium]|nr:Uma2 family endonuclease [Gemmatimonadaceae bacterium]